MALTDHLLTRREVFKAGTATAAGYWFLPFLTPRNVSAQAKVNPRGTARFCIFVMLDGGQSHVDAWDLKEHKWTPPEYNIKEIRSGVKWPMALYPKLASQIDKYTLVRSVEAWDSVHGRAQYYVQAAHPFNPALQKEVPPMGAVVALERAKQRRPNDSLPGYVAINVTQSQAGLLKSGFLPAAYSPFHIDTTTSLSTYSLADNEKQDFLRRWELLKSFDARLRNDDTLAAKAFRDYNDHYAGAVQLMSDPRTAPLFRFREEDRKRYGANNTGDACILARNIIEADAGTQFIFLQQDGWDHHKDIYVKKNHWDHSVELDAALGSLIEDLDRIKRKDGRSLLDETMVVCMGEFGRTPGPPNGLSGRDHYQYAFTVLMAGGGIKGGQIIGKTDELGAKVLDSQWGLKRSIYMEDIATTVYSAMGIDWTKVVRETPSGRNFYYVEPLAAQTSIANREISILFG